MPAGSWRTARSSIGLMVLALLARCSDNSKSPMTPAPSSFALSGQVRLEGTLTNDVDQILGVQRVTDAAGVMVHLSGPGGRNDSTRTVNGSFVFHDLAPGTYRARTWVVPTHVIESAEIQITDHDVVEPDTLVQSSLGDLHSYPNPSVPEGIGNEFTAHSEQTYMVEVRTVAGDQIWSYSQAVPPGYYHVHWDGDDSTEHVAPTGAYWVIAHVDGDVLYALVFWSADSGPPSPGDCGHINADGMFLEQDGAVLVTDWRGVQSGELHARTDAWSDGIHVQFLRSDSTAFAVADTCPENRLTWAVGDTAVAAVELVEGTKWTFQVRGKRTGSTDLVLNAWHQAHIHLSSRPIPIVIDASTPARQR